MTSKQIVLFDVDGVLIHGYHAREELRQCWDKDLEKDFGIERKRFTEEFIFDPFIKTVINGKRPLADALSETLPKLGYHGSVQDFIKYWLEKDSNVNHDLFSFIEKLHACERVDLYIATNQEHNRAEYLMKQLGFNKYFKDIFHSARIGHIKPDPKYFKTIGEILGLTENDPTPIFFDDTPNVVDAARKHGWIAHEFYDTQSLFQDDFIASLIED